jgi:hypothetical protein
MDWSPNSRFLVLTTDLAAKSSTYKFLVFGIEDKTLRSMNTIVGQVASAWFEIEAPDIIKLDVKDPTADKPYKSKTVNVSLGENFAKMPKEPVKP